MSPRIYCKVGIGIYGSLTKILFSLYITLMKPNLLKNLKEKRVYCKAGVRKHCAQMAKIKFINVYN